MKIDRFLKLNSAAAVVISAREIGRAFNGEFGNIGMTIDDCLILTSLYFEKDRSSRPSALAATFKESKSNTSHIVSRLEAKRLVRRSSLVGDRRGSVITLTSQGEKLALKLIKIFDGIQKRLESANGGEQKTERLNLRIYQIATLLTEQD